LPIDGSTLIYGSANCGRDVWAKEPEINAFLATLGQGIGLSEHLAGVLPSTAKVFAYPSRPTQARSLIYSLQVLALPCDVEVHRGHDGRLYMLDVARVNPPVKASSKVSFGHLYRLFR